MAQIEFEDNTEQIIEEMRMKAIAWLEEAGGEIKSQVASNSDVQAERLREASGMK